MIPISLNPIDLYDCFCYILFLKGVAEYPLQVSGVGRAAPPVTFFAYWRRPMFFLFSSLPAEPPQKSSYTPIGSLVMRVYWLVIGHLLIFSFGVAILMNHLQNNLLINCCFWVSVVLCPIARWVDIKRYKGQTSEGEPATMQHWKKYTLFVVGYAVPLWIAVQFLARVLDS